MAFSRDGNLYYDEVRPDAGVKLVGETARARAREARDVRIFVEVTEQELASLDLLPFTSVKTERRPERRRNRRPLRAAVSSDPVARIWWLSISVPESETNPSVRQSLVETCQNLGERVLAVVLERDPSAGLVRKKDGVLVAAESDTGDPFSDIERRVDIASYAEWAR